MLPTLRIIEALMAAPRTLAELCAVSGEGERGVARRVDEARHLGAEIQPPGHGGDAYRLLNADAIERRGLLSRWIELEQAEATP